MTSKLLNLPESTMITIDDVKWNDYITTKEELLLLAKLNIPF